MMTQVREVIGRQGGDVWKRVVLVENEDSYYGLWGDITQLYPDIYVWTLALRQADWEWDYFINYSGADIPIVPHHVRHPLLKG
jgi:hypothetical protein